MDWQGCGLIELYLSQCKPAMNVEIQHLLKAWADGSTLCSPIDETAHQCRLLFPRVHPRGLEYKYARADKQQNLFWGH